MSRYDKLKNVSKRVSTTNTQQADTGSVRNNNRINQVASQKKWVKESEKRPHSRNRNDSGKSGSVKAGKGLGKTKPLNR